MDVTAASRIPALTTKGLVDPTRIVRRRPRIDFDRIVRSTDTLYPKNADGVGQKLDIRV